MSDFELIEAIKRNPRAELQVQAPLNKEEALDHLRETSAPVWMERDNTKIGPCTKIGRWLLFSEALQLLDLCGNDYGETFVFWATKPTEEERIAAEALKDESRKAAVIDTIPNGNHGED